MFSDAIRESWNSNTIYISDKLADHSNSIGVWNLVFLRQLRVSSIVYVPRFVDTSFVYVDDTPFRRKQWETLAYETHVNLRDLLAIRSRYFRIVFQAMYTDIHHADGFRAIFERLRSRYAYYVKKQTKTHLYTNSQSFNKDRKLSSFRSTIRI